MKKNSNKKPKFKASHIVEKFYKVLEFLLSKLGPLKREFKIIVNKLKPLTFRAIDSTKDFSTKNKDSIESLKQKLRIVLNFIWSIRYIVAIILVAFLAWNKFTGDPSSSSTNEKYRLLTTKPTIGEISEFVKTSGKVVPKKEAKVYSKIDLPLKKLNVKYGDLVEEGQVLLEMDSGILKTEIENKIREVSILETAFNQKILKTKNDKELWEKGFIPKAEYQESANESGRIKIDLDAAKLQLKKFEASIQDTKIISPIKGRIDYMDPGITEENVSRGSVKLGINVWFFTISSGSEGLNLNLSIDGRDISKVKVGQQVVFKVDSYAEREFTGEIVKIIEPINLKPHTNKSPVFYELIARINENDAGLKSGLSVDAEIKIQTKINIKRIPRSALRFVPPKSVRVKLPPPDNATTLILWIANEDNSISAIPVETGIKDNQYIELLDNAPISKDDLIVVGAVLTEKKKKKGFALPQPKRY